MTAVDRLSVLFTGHNRPLTEVQSAAISHLLVWLKVGVSYCETCFMC